MNMPLVMGIVVAIGIGAGLFLFSTGFDDLAPSENESNTELVNGSNTDEEWSDIDKDLDIQEKKESNAQKFANIEASIESNPKNRRRAHKYGVALVGLGEFERAEKFYLRQLKTFPNDDNIAYGLAWCYETTGKWQKSTEYYSKAIQLNDHRLARNNLAWILATCPDDTIRDGFKAVALARKSIGNDKSPKPALLDTLAAAYAETGEFEKAIRIQKLVIRKSKENKSELEHRLKLYQSKKPYRTDLAAK